VVARTKKCPKPGPVAPAAPAPVTDPLPGGRETWMSGGGDAVLVWSSQPH